MRDITDLPIDVEPVAEAIDQMARTMEDYAREVRAAAQLMREKNDIEYANEALGAVKNCQGNIRIELVQARVLRAINWAIRDQGFAQKRETPVTKEDILAGPTK